MSPQEIQQLRDEVAACHAMLVDALSYVDPDHGDGQEFQDRLVAFLEVRNLHRPAIDPAAPAG